MYDLDGIRDKVSLVVLAEEAGAHFDSPHRLVSRCPLPLHAGDRSSQAFAIYDNGRKWKCHSSCPSDANGGDMIAFYMAWKGVDFKTAVSELATRAGITALQDSIPVPKTPQPLSVPATPEPAWRARAEKFIRWAETNLVSHQGAQDYLEKERGLSPETWRAFRLGYNPFSLYDDPARWGLTGKKIWLPRGLVIPGFWQGQPSYIKVRRPLPGQAVERYIGPWISQDGLPEVKFGGPRGGTACMFRLEFLDHLPVLVLTEGEWDAMLVWEYCPDLCDVATLGGAGAKLDVLDLSLLTHYLAVLVIHDDDKAGEKGREYIAQLHAKFDRVQSVKPPAHDLTDFWKSGGDVRTWLAGQVSTALEKALQGISEPSLTIDLRKRIARLVKDETAMSKLS